MSGNVYRALSLLLLLAVVASCQRKTSSTESPPADRSVAVSLARKPKAPITFLSTQMNPVAEAGKMRNVILKDFPGEVAFRPNDNSYILGQVSAILRDDPSASVLVGALHGDLSMLRDDGSLRPLDDLYASLKDRSFAGDMEKLSMLGGKERYYIPWMQASFVMAASRKALAYLPKGADIESLTYEQLYSWAKAIYDATGRKALGFPAGQKGLMHRFFQGYLYPSFTASTLLKFRSRDAEGMWVYFKHLWSLVDPGSLGYSTMSEPLLRGDVWIAWDHTARLVKAFQERPKDFVAFPAPAGPKGRGYMAVVSGLAIPKSVKDPGDPASLIEYLTLPEIQERTLRETGFFPVVAEASPSRAPEYLRELSLAVGSQSRAPDAIATLLPVGLGERAGDYDSFFMLAFSKIALEGESIRTVLNRNAAELQRIVDERNAACWLPDASDERPCRIE